jgi:FKBP-type peptidyl-prolyl cis-trans isomerase FklB
LIACSEADDTIDEFANWQVRNDSYFSTQFAQAQQRIAAGDRNWRLIRCYAKSDSSFVEKQQDYVIVERIDTASAKETTSPLFTDSVSVHYRGRLMPSDNYPAGYEFDSSFRMEFDPIVASPSTFALNSSLVLGFSTILQHMRRGDHWRVWIPYQQGYGSTANQTIPGYSTLIFELWLEDFWH